MGAYVVTCLHMAPRPSRQLINLERTPQIITVVGAQVDRRSLQGGQGIAVSYPGQNSSATEKSTLAKSWCRVGLTCMMLFSYWTAKLPHPATGDQPYC